MASGSSTVGSWALGLLAAGALAVGCNEEVVRGPNPCNAERCDILDEDCQRRVVEVVRCFRGGDGDVMPEVRVIDEDEYKELVRGEPPSEEERLRYARIARGMALLELAPAMQDDDEVIDEYAANIAAAYLTAEKSVVIIDRGGPLDSQAAVATFAHEVVHALQDEEIGLREFYRTVRPTLDAALAARALIEGEGTLYDLLVYAALDGAQPWQLDWLGYYRRYQIAMLLDGYEDEAPLALSFVRFPYAFGGHYVWDKWRDRGQRAIAELYDAPPLSTADVLSFENLNDAQLEDVAAFREVSRLAPAAGYAALAYDELGAFLLDGFLHRVGATAYDLLDPRVMGLFADGVTVLYDEAEDRVVTAWRLRFGPRGAPSDREVAELRAALGAPTEDELEQADDATARVLLDDRDLIMIVSDGPLDAAFRAEDLAWEPAPSDPEAAAEPPMAAALCGPRCTLR